MQNICFLPVFSKQLQIPYGTKMALFIPVNNTNKFWNLLEHSSNMKTKGFFLVAEGRCENGSFH